MLPKRLASRLAKVPPACRSAVAENDVVGETFVADVLYNAHENILILGEVNFTFTQVLAERLRRSQLVSTSPLDINRLIKLNGPSLERRLNTVSDLGVIIRPSTLLRHLRDTFKPSSFDKVIYNVRADEGSKRKGQTRRRTSSSCEDDNDNLAKGTFSLLMSSVSQVLRGGGEMHLRITDSTFNRAPYVASTPSSLQFVHRIDLSGILPMYSIGGQCFFSDNQEKSTAGSTFVFRKPNVTVSGMVTDSVSEVCRINADDNNVL